MVFDLEPEPRTPETGRTDGQTDGRRATRGEARAVGSAAR